MTAGRSRTCIMHMRRICDAYRYRVRIGSFPLLFNESTSCHLGMVCAVVPQLPYTSRVWVPPILKKLVETNKLLTRICVAYASVIYGKCAALWVRRTTPTCPEWLLLGAQGGTCPNMVPPPDNVPADTHKYLYNTYNIKRSGTGLGQMYVHEQRICVAYASHKICAAEAPAAYNSTPVT